MHAISRRVATATTLLTLVGCTMQEAPATWVADIQAAAQRYWNRQLVVEGQVTRVEADPVGTTRGRYLLVDDSDNNGIIVVSKSLPAPGEVVRVEGQVVQDPRNAVRPMIRELTRAEPRVPMTRYAVIGLAGVAIVLIGVLVWMLLRGDRAGDEEHETAGGYASRAHGGDRNGVKGRAGTTHEDAVTRDYSPVEKQTEDFEFWGVELAVLEGPDAGKVFPIGTSPLHVGRVSNNGRRNTIVLSDSTVSREQATITRNRTSGAFSLKHDGNRNATLVNGREVDSAELVPGTKIRFGSTVAEFRRVQQ